MTSKARGILTLYLAKGWRKQARERVHSSAIQVVKPHRHTGSIVVLSSGREIHVITAFAALQKDWFAYEVTFELPAVSEGEKTE